MTPSTDNTRRAVCVILLTVLALAFGDALIKRTSNDFALWQIFVIRSLLVIPVLVAIIAVMARDALALPRALGWTMLRSLLLVVMWVVYYMSLPHLPLSAAAAAYYTLPIFITLFSALIGGDKITRLGWIAVALGFVGVCLILRPKAGDFNTYALLPLISAMLYAVAMILTRTKCRAEHPLMLALALNIAFVIVGALAAGLTSRLPEAERTGFLLSPWSTMGTAEWGVMVVLAVSILIGSIGTAIAYQNGPPHVIGTFDFAYVGFAVLWSVVFFADVPDGLSMLGMALIISAGVIAIRQ